MEDQDLNGAAIEHSGCAQARLLTAHAESLDSAYKKLCEHDTVIEHLKHQTDHALARIEAVERNQTDAQRTMIRIEGRLSNVESKIEHISATATSTHALLVRHVSDEILTEEKVQKGLVRITGAVGAILVLLALLYSSGHSHFWTLVSGFLGG
ncbi:MAG: hypothetical protein ACUVR3_08490 [Candidatus Roseilinea sp.]|uniref:hypothetical protein n=1 Tax=Candidatus Roseilinea sp. TaxID=2838777 RepID=UPI0040495703